MMDVRHTLRGSWGVLGGATGTLCLLASGCGTESGDPSPSPSVDCAQDDSCVTEPTPTSKPTTNASPTQTPDSSTQTYPAGSSCDGLSSDTAVPGFFVDLDGDGFGAQAATCGDSPYLVQARGDCADGDPARHPGASDANGDDIDSDCGGSDGAQPSVGISVASRETLLEALIAAKEGDTVWVGPGTYVESFLSFSGKTLRLLSTHGPAQTVIDGNGTGPILLLTDGEVQEAEVRGFALRNAVASSQDAAVVVRNSSPSLRELVIEDCLSQNGGGITLRDSQALLEDVIIRSNEALEAGGGLYLDGGAPRLVRVQVEGNLAPTGGGLYAQNLTLSLSDVHFTRNSAYGHGGNALLSGVSGSVSASTFEQGAALRGAGLYLSQSTLSMQDGVVADNHALSDEATSSQGGGLFVDASSLTLERTRVVHNDAVQGGGLFSYAGTLEATDGVFQQNTATTGGGLYATSSTVGVQSLLLEENVSAEAGGGAFLTQTFGTLERLDANRNRAGTSGGGVYFENVSLAIGALTLLENDASALGGGMAYGNVQPSSSTLRISSLHAGWNHAQVGGGVHVRDAMLAASSAVLEGNRAETLGGGVVSDGAGVTLADAQLLGNAGGSGGGGAVISDGVLSLPYALITGNLSYADGGGISAQNGLLDVLGAQLAGNTALNRGGAIFQDDPTEWGTFRELRCSGNYASYGACLWTNAYILLLKSSVVMGNQAWILGGGVFSESSYDADPYTSDVMGNAAPSPQSFNFWWCVGAECCGDTYVAPDDRYDNGCVPR